MRKWEYCTVYWIIQEKTPFNRELITIVNFYKANETQTEKLKHDRGQIIARLGEHGWELVTISRIHDEKMNDIDVYHLKRLVEA
jgi:hypothetical protein